MLTTDYRETLDKLWNTFWPNTHIKPLPVIAFIDTLLLCKELDELEIKKERASSVDNVTGKKLFFRMSQQHLRWHFFQNLHWEGLHKLFFRRGGILSLTKKLVANNSLPRFARSREDFVPTPAMLVTAVKLVSELEIVNDGHRAEMIDYIFTKANIAKPVAPSFSNTVISTQTGENNVLRKRSGQPSKILFLFFSVLVIGAIGASLGYIIGRKNTDGSTNTSSTASVSSSEHQVSSTEQTAKKQDQQTATKTKKAEQKSSKKAVIPASSKNEKEVPASGATSGSVANKTHQARDAKKEVTSVQRDRNNSGKGLYKIRSKAYFHNSPDTSTRRNAFVNHWNNSYATLKALDEKDGFVYVVFHNHLNQTSKGWLLKKDLVPVEEDAKEEGK